MLSGFKQPHSPDEPDSKRAKQIIHCPACSYIFTSQSLFGAHFLTDHTHEPPPVVSCPPKAISDRQCVQTAVATAITLAPEEYPSIHTRASLTKLSSTAVGLCPVIQLDQATLQDDHGNSIPMPPEQGLLVDTASTVSYISGELLKMLPKQYFKTLKTGIQLKVSMLGQNSCTMYTDLVSIRLKVGKQEIRITALVMNDANVADPPRLCSHIIEHYSSVLDQKPLISYNHRLQFPAGFKISILLGQPRCWQICGNSEPVDPSEIDPQLFRISTPLGHVLSGTLEKTCACSNMAVSYISATEQLSQNIEKLWSFEQFAQDSEQSLTQSEIQALQWLEDTTVYDSSKKLYTTRLIWSKGKPPPFKNTYSMALKRFLSMERTLLKKPPEITAAVCEAVEEHIRSSAYVAVPPEKESWYKDPENTSIFVIPPRLVFRSESESTAVRYCMDASARAANGEVLNDQLLKGPCQLSNMVCLQLRWRQKRYAFLADLSRMFLSIAIDEQDRDYLCFLWRKPNSGQPIKVYRSHRVVFGIRCSPCVASYILSKHAKSVLQNPNSAENERKAAELLQNSVYCDDILGSADSKSEAISLIKGIESVMATANFSAMKYRSSCVDILKHLPPEKHAKKAMTRLGDSYLFTDSDHAMLEPGLFKSLGSLFEVATDSYAYGGFLDLKARLDDKHSHTKRDVASAVATLSYDLTGYRSAFVLCFRILLKKVMLKDKAAGENNDNRSWNRLLNEEEETLFKELISQLPVLDDVTLKRHLPFHLEFELYGFCDASNNGLAAVFYLRTYDCNTNARLVSFVLGKSKVRPMNTDSDATDSIPRLELMSCCILAELFLTIQEAYQLPTVKYTCFTDSSTVFYWMKAKPGTLNPFQGNRISYIQSSGIKSLHYVRSAENPADLGAKGCHAKDLLPDSGSRWVTGPTWLSQGKQTWPSFQPPSQDYSDQGFLKGFKRTFVVETLLLQTYVTLPLLTHKFHDVTIRLFISSHDWLIVLNRVATILCFLDWLKNRKKRSTRANPRKQLTLSQARIRARLLCFSFIQQKEFSDDFYALSLGESLDKDSPLKGHNPQLTSIKGVMVIRSRSRLDYSTNVTEMYKNPILLPKFASNDLTSLTRSFVMALHTRLFHCTSDALWFHLRQDTFILGGRAQIKKVSRNCVTCNERHTRDNLDRPLMAPLPENRVNLDKYPSLSQISIDYCGPFLCRNTIYSQSDVTTRQNPGKLKKVYILILVDMITRFQWAILCPAMTLDVLLLALKAQFGQWGFPKKIFSDCYSTFKSAGRLLRDVMAKGRHKLEKFALENNFEWSFGVPFSPHSHGNVESAVKLFKNACYTQFKSPLDWFSFQSMVSHCLTGVNRRPLYATETEDRGVIAITPYSLTFGHDGGDVIDFEHLDEHVHADLRVLWQERQKATQKFSKTYKRQYYDKLLLRSFWNQPSKSLVKEGDFLLIDRQDQFSKLHSWPVGKVLSLEKGNDDVVRRVTVRLNNGDYDVTTLPDGTKQVKVLRAPREIVADLHYCRFLEARSSLANPNRQQIATNPDEVVTNTSFVTESRNISVNSDKVLFIL